MSNVQLQIAQTIISQYGRAFPMMVGLKKLVYLNAKDNVLGGVQFSIGGGAAKGINKVIVKLMANDTYTVQYGKFSPSKLTFKVIAEFSDVYCDYLAPNFEETTGFLTHM